MTDNYQQFYEEHKNRLFSYLLYMCGDYETSLDIMQESFTRHFQHYRHKASSSPALLFTIARNALIDHHRLRRKQATIEKLPAETTDDAEQVALSREEYRRVKETVDKLPESDREILSLAVGGLAYKEIAIILGISETNAKVKIHRARTKIRQMLSNEEES
ncbi:MAG: RNA polymerase sigma factor [Desulfobulbaceae bacterium]|nr:RNA polymerase sigma factor [Desulfobulbaceae bacterium]